MGIIRRFKAIMEANFNELLGSMEHPEKMIDYYLDGLEKDLGEVKYQTAQVIVAHEKAIKEREKCEANLKDLGILANKASDNADDMIVITSEMAAVQNEYDNLVATELMAADNRQKMEMMHDKLNSDIRLLRQKRSMLKAKLAVVNTNKIVSKYTVGGNRGVSYNMAQFSRIEEKVDDMLMISNAMQSLEDRSLRTPILALKEKYKDVPVKAIEAKDDVVAEEVPA